MVISAEEAVGAEGVVASNRPVVVTEAEGAGVIVTASGVVIDGGPGAGRSARVPEGQQEGYLGHHRANTASSSVSNCDIQGFLLITSERICASRHQMA